MIEYKVYSDEILLNNVLFAGMSREEMEKHILKMLRDKDLSVFKVDVDVLYLLKPTVKNTIKVRVYRRIKVNKEGHLNECEHKSE